MVNYLFIYAKNENVSIIFIRGSLSYGIMHCIHTSLVVVTALHRVQETEERFGDLKLRNAIYVQ